MTVRKTGIRAKAGFLVAAAFGAVVGLLPDRAIAGPPGCPPAVT